MADYREPRTPGSIPGSSGTATSSTPTSSTGGSNGIVGRVREQATAQLATQKTKATDGLGSVAQAVRETTRHLREGQHETVAHYAEQAADQIERFSQRLRNKDVGELMTDAQRLARQKPALFVGGAFALGLIGARFLKSSASDSDSSYGGSAEHTRGQSSGAGGRPVQNAYGNRVPSAGSAVADASGRRPDYPPTEGL